MLKYVFFFRFNIELYMRHDDCELQEKRKQYDVADFDLGMCASGGQRII